MTESRHSPMPRPVRGAAYALCMLGAALALSGCLTRVLEIRSDPPGALAYVNGQPVGTTPAVYKFTQYGDRSLIVTKDEHTTINQTCTLEAPWWACFPCDLFVELWPGTVVDTHEVALTLQPAVDKEADLDGLLKNLGEAGRAMHADTQ